MIIIIIIMDFFLFSNFSKDPPSPEMSENMHQSPDTPECAMPYRLSNAIHQESQSSFVFGLQWIRFISVLCLLD